METLDEIIKLSDVQLLELVCTAADDEIAYKQFLNRFLQDVKDECDKVCARRKLDSHVGIQIAHETFERVRKYKSFRSDQIKLANERKAILVYLNRISTSLFNDFYKKEHRQEIIHKTYFDDIAASNDAYIDVEELHKKKEITEKIFKTLNKNERTVLLKDIEYKRHHKYLPDTVIDSLAEELKVKRDTIRKIRERAIQKINNAINAVNNG